MRVHLSYLPRIHDWRAHARRAAGLRASRQQRLGPSFPQLTAVQRVITPQVMAAENPPRPIGIAVAADGLKIIGDTLYVVDRFAGLFAFRLPV